MFNTAPIKNYKRTKPNKISAISDGLFEIGPSERTLPYFSIVSEQVFADARYLGLSRQDKGDFWRLILLMWPRHCILVRHPGAIAEDLGMQPSEWQSLEARLVAAGLLAISPNEYYLIQPELREQYLQTLKANNSKRRT